MTAVHWWFQRVSGLLLILFAGAHVGAQYALLPFALTGGARVIVNAGTLALVVYHGVAGVTTVVDDYVRSGLARGALRAALWIGGLALLAYGWRGLGVASP